MTALELGLNHDNPPRLAANLVALWTAVPTAILTLWCWQKFVRRKGGKAG